MNLRPVAVLTAAAALLALSSMGQTESGSAAPGATHILIRPDMLRWTQMSADLMEGTPAFAMAEAPQVSLVAGDPSQAGAPFTLRIRMAPGTRVPPHWHPTDEHITVLQGRFGVGMGDVYDEASLQELPAGSYALMPKSMTHFARAMGETVVQVHGIGPFKSVWVSRSSQR
jgi:quercetin dioxygenase-like cupin family protein